MTTAGITVREQVYIEIGFEKIFIAIIPNFGGNSVQISEKGMISENIILNINVCRIETYFYQKTARL